MWLYCFSLNILLNILANLLMELGEPKKAEKIYWRLVERNPENVNYFKRIEECRGLSRFSLLFCLADWTTQ